MAKKGEALDGLVTRQQLADAFGVTAGTITRWERDGMPVARKSSRGRHTLFSIEAVKAWRVGVEAVDGAALSLSEERAKLAKKQGEKLDLDKSERLRELVHRDQVIREGVSFVKSCQAKLRTIPRRAAQLGIIQHEQIAGLDGLIRDVMTELSRWRTVVDEPPAKSKRRRAA